MKKIIKFATLGLVYLTTVASVQGANYIKFDGVDGEASMSSGSSATITVTNSGAGTEVNAKSFVGSVAILDGSKSVDDEAIKTFLWTQVSGPRASIKNATSVKASIVPLVAGTYVFELKVSDENGRTVATRKVELIAIEASVSTIVSADSDRNGESATPVIIEIEPIEGDSDDESKKVPVEYNWKVEEGEKFQGIEPDEIDAANDALGGGGLKGGISVAAGDVNGLTEEERQEFLATVKSHAEVKSGQDLENFAKGVLLNDAAVDDIAVDEEGVSISYKARGKLFGIIPITFTETVMVNPIGVVKVRFPWFSFLVNEDVEVGDIETDISLSNRELTGTGEVWDFSAYARTINIISNILKTKHDTAKNSISNVR